MHDFESTDFSSTPCSECNVHLASPEDRCPLYLSQYCIADPCCDWSGRQTAVNLPSKHPPTLEVAAYASRAAEKLHHQAQVAEAMIVFARTSPFKPGSFR